MNLPQKCILNEQDLSHFPSTRAYQRLMTYLNDMCESIQGQPTHAATLDPHTTSPACQLIIDALDSLSALIKAFPPTEQPHRFGNKAFRSWYAAMCDQLETCLIEPLLSLSYECSLSKDQITAELRCYFTQSFGNEIRLDYGTGHELNFYSFLICLYEMHLLTAKDHAVVVLIVFNRYIKLMREIQTVYLLEPAGSHGVWGLDDYQFLPFLFGAWQLVDHPSILPSDINDEAARKEHSDTFLFFDCITFIHQMKSGPFFEHSPILFDISAVPHWRKVAMGMIKMFKGEVLNKLPVIRHALFGYFLPYHMDHNCQTRTHASSPTETN